MTTRRPWSDAETELLRERYPCEPTPALAARMGRQQQPVPWDGTWEGALARFGALDDGIQRRVEATDAARNAIVPQAAAEFVAAFLSADVRQSLAAA